MPGMRRIAILAAAAALTMAGQGHAEAFAKPDVVRWGATTAELETALQGKCAKGFVVRPIKPPFLPVVKERQVQLDCNGFMFMGKPRWTEFVIGDDRLQMVWIMVDAAEQDAIVKAMAAAHGAPDRKNDKYVAFTHVRTAWRNKPPEVLFYAPELDGWARPWFD
jgi:hypothetical protein